MLSCLWSDYLLSPIVLASFDRCPGLDATHWPLPEVLDSLELRRQNVPQLDQEAVFRKKVESLPVVLNKNEDIRTEAGEILRTFIDKIVLLPDKETGKMRISVSSRPHCILASTKPSAETKVERMIQVVAEERLELPTRGL